MILQVGNMWDMWDTADLFLITTNSTIKKNGALVMGRGIAHQARDRFSGIDHTWGQHIEQLCGHLGVYGLLISAAWPDKKIGAFQVKQHFRDRADPALIAASAARLRAWCTTHPQATVHLNFPGIGNGRLDRSVVLPLLHRLPDSVTVWELPKETHDDPA